MQMATFTVEFSFNEVMYQKFDGVAMISLFGSAIANIFVNHYENKLKPLI